MEDKKFDEIMKAYVRSTSKGMEHDLSKMQYARIHSSKKVKRRIAFAACSIVLSAIVCLAIVLPLTIGINNDEGETTQYYFSDAEYMRDIPFTSKEEIAEYGNDFMLPGIDSMALGGMLKMNDVTGTIDGIMLEVSVYNIYFDYIRMLMYYDNYVYVEGALFDACVNVTLWNGIEVRYNINERTSGVYDWMITFNNESVDYYIAFVFYGEMEVNAILDMIF